MSGAAVVVALPAHLAAPLVAETQAREAYLDAQSRLRALNCEEFRTGRTPDPADVEEAMRAVVYAYGVLAIVRGIR